MNVNDALQWGAVATAVVISIAWFVRRYIRRHKISKCKEHSQDFAKCIGCALSENCQKLKQK